MDKRELIEIIVSICSRMDKKGFVANHDGNVTAKWGNFLLGTPTSIPKYAITSNLILTLNDKGEVIEGSGKPFSELKLHLEAYRIRPDANAVVHCHPPFATARGLTGRELLVNIPEAVISIGRKIPVVPLIMPGDENIYYKLKDALTMVDVIMIQGNGVLSIGNNVEQAYLRCELVEHVVKIDSYAHIIGKPIELTSFQEEALLKKRQKVFSQIPSSEINDERICSIITEEVEKVLSLIH